MKRLMYLIPISVTGVLMFVSVALAQSTQDQGALDQYGQGSTDANAPTPTSTVNDSQRTVTDNIEPFGFYPAHIQIEPGTTVEWFNDDANPHTVTADDGSFDSGELKQNQTYSVRFDVEGKWYYHSALDPDMTGSVIVRVPSGGEATAPGDSTSQPTQSTDNAAQPTASSAPTTGESTQPSSGS
jgi:plastocyanin